MQRNTFFFRQRPFLLRSSIDQAFPSDNNTFGIPTTLNSGTFSLHTLFAWLLTGEMTNSMAVMKELFASSCDGRSINNGEHSSKNAFYTRLLSKHFMVNNLLFMTDHQIL